MLEHIDYKVFINLVVIYSVLYYLFNRYKVSNDVKVLLFLHSFLVFCTNYVLIDPFYMDDQFIYIKVTNEIRDTLSFSTTVLSKTVNYAARFFAFFPPRTTIDIP